MPTDETTEANGKLTGEQRVRFLAMTFRRIHLVVFLIFIFAVVQMITLWRVCQTGMRTATSLERQGLPTLYEVAALQENLALYRLDSYEYLFAQQDEKAGRAKAAEDTAAQMSGELRKIRTLLPEGQGQQLAASLETAVNDLDTQFQKVRALVDTDFPAAMKSMDQDIPPRTERVTAAANALKDYGYHFSSGQADATFAAFGRIKTTAIFFGAANSLVALCAVVFVLLAARRSRAHLSETLARLDERTQELQQTNTALQRQQAELRILLNMVPAMIVFKNAENVFLRVNQRFADRAGKPVAEIEGKSSAEILPQEAAMSDAADLEVMRSGAPRLGTVETRQAGKGEQRWFQTDRVPVCNNDGKVAGIIIMTQDITERKRIEAQLIQSQKMETVGKLAGGVAHEFNSILTAVICQSELLLYDLPDGSPLAHNATEIIKGANRIAALTRQLLAYGRKQFLRPEALNLNQVITSMREVLGHLMGGEMVDVKIVPAAGLRLVEADAGQIEQVIINLAMNARDAMPNGGKLTLETANVTLDQEYVSRFPELEPGGYVMLAVSDTGKGMSEQVKARVFEPFFTTKDIGQGTGLGLSTCYGIIKQSGGHISVYSEPGRGTTFKIYLPQMEPAAKTPIERPDPPELPRGTETICWSRTIPPCGRWRRRC
jgi:PAS domain S-box-containing protein